MIKRWLQNWLSKELSRERDAKGYFVQKCKEKDRRISELEADNGKLIDFVKYLYAGPIEKVEEYYEKLPQSAKDAIEALPCYNEESE